MIMPVVVVFLYHYPIILIFGHLRSQVSNLDFCVFGSSEDISSPNGTPTFLIGMTFKFMLMKKIHNSVYLATHNV